MHLYNKNHITEVWSNLKNEMMEAERKWVITGKSICFKLLKFFCVIYRKIKANQSFVYNVVQSPSNLVWRNT
jgi:hypothetical protein